VSATRLGGIRRSQRAGRPGVRGRLQASRRRLKLATVRLHGLEALGLRVGFIGQRGEAQLGVAVDSLAVRPNWVGSLARRTGSRLDLLLIDAVPVGFSSEALRALIEEARGLRARVVGLWEGEYRPVWAGSVDVLLELRPEPRPRSEHGGRAHASSRLTLVPPVDPQVVNPIGFRFETDRRLAAIGSLDRARPGGDDAHRTLKDASEWAEVDLFRADGPPTQSLPPGVRTASQARLDDQERRERIRDYRGVVDHAGLHLSSYEQVSGIVELSALGVPVLLRQLSAAARGMLGDELATALEPISLGTLEDRNRRELGSVRIRRAALRGHSVEEAWRKVAEEVGIVVPQRRNLSVVIATNRPSHLDDAIAQVNHQTYQPRELVLVLHGEQFSDDLEDGLKRRVEGELTVVRVSSEASLGDALNAGTDAASGEVITKMDDDDWYGPEHLWDLMLALEYSGAELVAKGAEFVYLQDLDLTIRRFVGKGESWNRTVAGGTLTITKDDLKTLGGWPPLAHGVDVYLIEDLSRAGGRPFRTHGFGYVYRRHASQTWAKDVDYFLRQSDSQWRGLELEASDAQWTASPEVDDFGSVRPPHPWPGGIPARRSSPRPLQAARRDSHRSQAPPRALASLRLAALAGRGHLRCFAPLCETIDAGSSGWRAALESTPPHLLLIESSWLHEDRPEDTGPVKQEEPARAGVRVDGGRSAAPERLERARDLVAWCQDRGIPTALWETAPHAMIATPISLMERVRHLFCADPEAVPQLAAQLEGRRPLELPLAAQVFPRKVTAFGERAPKVAFLWPWETGAGNDRGERIDELLDIAARYGAVIIDPNGDGPEPPRRMSRLLEKVDGYRGALAAFQRHRIVVAFDPRADGNQMVPQVVFDAAAGGNVVIVPSHLGTRRLMRFLVVVARGRRHAEHEIPRLLMDWEDWTAISRNSRRAVLNAHTYAHRMASVASVAGFSLVPAPVSPPRI
jgi:Glycosyl transferase family 2/Glycosyl transferases group 1